jgi:hypothetical protein
MSTITCPVCGNVSPANAMNCKQCGINLQFALQNPVEVERIKGNVVTIYQDGIQKRLAYWESKDSLPHPLSVKNRQVLS